MTGKRWGWDGDEGVNGSSGTTTDYYYLYL
jgi:hypothetical protein